MVSKGWVGSEKTVAALAGSRTRARTGTFWERRDWTTYFPVRPVAPATATRVTRVESGGGWGGVFLLSGVEKRVVVVVVFELDEVVMAGRMEGDAAWKALVVSKRQDSRVAIARAANRLFIMVDDNYYWQRLCDEKSEDF